MKHLSCLTLFHLQVNKNYFGYKGPLSFTRPRALSNYEVQRPKPICPVKDHSGQCHGHDQERPHFFTAATGPGAPDCQGDNL